jgi:glycerol-3-phosphate dehydrogenase (NAD(P)+)
VIGVVTGTDLGHALVERLRTDGREVVSAAPGQDFSSLAASRLIVVDCEPSALPELARAIGDRTDGNHLLAHTVRGLVGGESPIAVLRDETSVKRIGVLAGPIAPRELSAGRPVAAVIASRHVEVVDEFARELSTRNLRVYRSRDPQGVELSSGLSDLVTLGCGLLAGFGFGDATRALMVVRAVRELQRLTVALGGNPNTAGGMGGLGDILARSPDVESAPYKYGVALAKGTTGDGPEGHVAEIHATARSVRALAKRLKTPVHIYEGLADLLDGQVAAAALLTRLMTLPILDD